MEQETPQTEKFHIALAGQVIEVRPLYPYVREYCRDYLTEEKAQFSVTTTQADVDWEREKSAREDVAEGIPVRHFSDEYLETLAVYRKIVTGLLEQETLLFHGSVVAVDGEGYLFTAKSGTGKSTHTRLWREVFGHRAVMINDDKPLLRLTETGVLACGTPWNGKHRLSTNCSVPLKAICILERDSTNHIRPISPKEGFAMLLQQSYRPNDPAGMAKTLTMVEELSHRVKLYRLGCNQEQEAAWVAYRGMSEGGKIQ